MGYSNLYWTCPFFSKDGRLSVTCEAGHLKFQQTADIQHFTHAYCASHDWKYCTLAKQMLRYYDRLEERRMEEVRRRFRERHMGH